MVTITLSKPSRLETQIEAFCFLFPSYPLAHIALKDYKLDDNTLLWLLEEFIPKNREAFIWDNPEVMNADIDGLVYFLRYLLTVPETIREEILGDD